MKRFMTIVLAAAAWVCEAQEITVDGIRYYGDWMQSATIAAFQDTALSGDIVIPSAVTYEGKSYTVTKFERYAFAECRQLRSVVIPASVNETLYDCGYEFYNCTSLEEVTLSPNMQILQGTFMGCTALKRIVIPEGVKYLDYVFENCTALCDVSLPDGLAEIGRECFYGCLSLTEVTIPASVTSVGTDAFAFCRGLASVTCRAVIPPACLGRTGPRVVTVNPFREIAPQAVLYVPAEALQSYRDTRPWSDFYRIESITDTGMKSVPQENRSSRPWSLSGCPLAAPFGLYIQDGKVRIFHLP